MSYRKQVKRALLAGVATATFAAALPAVSSTTAYAQDYTTGLIRGTVQDTTGAIVAGATVEFKSNRGTTRTVTTDANGQFRAPRMPIGKYVVTVMKDGYETLSGGELSVAATAERSATFTLAIPGSTVEEIVVSGTAVAGYDFSSTTTGISVDMAETFNRLPLDRDVTSVALLAPGSSLGDTAFGRLPSFNGSSVGENVTYVNGMNISDAQQFLGAGVVPFEFIEQVDVKTGGYEAEFGRATGGVTSMVTKSGSDEFKFGADFYWEPQKLRENSETTFTYNRRGHSFNYRELGWNDQTTLNVWASGPVVKDKLYFFGMWQPRWRDSGGYTQSTKYQSTNNAPFWATKVDFFPFEGHHIEGTWYGSSGTVLGETWSFDGDTDGDKNPDPMAIEDPDSFTGDSFGQTWDEFGTDTQIYKYTGNFTDWFSLAAMYGKNKKGNGSFGEGAEFSNVIIDDAKVSKNAQGTTFVNNDSRENYRVDADFYFEAMGEHHIRIGIDNEKIVAEDNVIQTGDKHAYRVFTVDATNQDYFGDGSVILPIGSQYMSDILYSRGGTFETNQSAWYIQDSWQPTDNLTINLGVRSDTFELKNNDGETWLKTSNQIAPRLGFSWDPKGDGVSRVYGSVGRYYLPVATRASLRAQTPEFYTTKWSVVDSYNASGVPVGGTILETSVTGDGTVQTPRDLVDQNLEAMYTQEALLGYEHDFGNGWSASVRGMYREIGKLTEDVAVDFAVLEWIRENRPDAAAIDNETYTSFGSLSAGAGPDGIPDYEQIWVGFHQYVFTNPGSDMTIETKDLPGENGNFITMELSAEDLRYPKGKREYLALDFEVSREWDGVWSFDANYTLSRTYGNYEGPVKSDNGQTDTGLTTDFDQPQLTDGALGKLPTHKAHRLKLRGAYQVNEWLGLGASLQIESPRKFGCIGRAPVGIPFDSANDATWLYGASSRYCNGEVVDRDSRMSSDWVKKLDLTLNITPAFADEIPGDLTFRAAIFNVFNSQAITDVHEIGFLSFSTPNEHYGRPNAYQTPRYVRLSAHFNF